MALPLSSLFGTSLFGRREQPGWIDPPDLAALLGSAEPPLVVDVRSAGEFAGPLGHIGPAANIPLDELAARAAEVTGAGRPVILVCHTDRRSVAAAQHLRGLGMHEVGVLRGGMLAWIQAGLPVG